MRDGRAEPPAARSEREMAEAHVPSSSGHAHGGGHASTGAHTGGGHATLKTYINVAIVLAIITAIEVATLYVPGIPNGILVTSLLLMSIVKFILVVGFFMHLKYDAAVMRAMFVGPLIIAILIILAIMALFGAFILLPRPTL
jgi:cytochrome c oxidase subunit 4